MAILRQESISLKGYLHILKRFQPEWNWELKVEKIAKLTISTTAGLTKEEEADYKNFHYVYILKKKAPIVEAPKPIVEQKAEGEENEDDK